MILRYILGKYGPNTAGGKGSAHIASDIQTTDDLDEGESIFGGNLKQFETIVSKNMYENRKSI